MTIIFRFNVNINVSFISFGEGVVAKLGTLFVMKQNLFIIIMSDIKQGSTCTMAYGEGIIVLI